ncbi:MAG: DUF4366 domain-containing protein [Anaerococcus sp.]|nr:DUF4366 domain-containing protein [Anaerococcus sp.]
MKKNGIKVALVLLFMFTIIPSISMAKSNESEITSQLNNIYTPENNKELENLFDEDVYNPSDEKQKIPYQEVPKIPDSKNVKSEQKERSIKSCQPVKPVKGGNTKAINSLATKENKARGTVLENVDESGEDLTPKVGDNEVRKEGEENPVDVRQFLTFQTKSGKTMHLIIDHSQNQENVQLLTEVGEQDLLNMIEGESDTKSKEEKVVRKEEPIKKEEPQKEKEKEKKSGVGLYIFIVLIMLVGIGVGYYFKVYKKREEDTIEDDEDYDELEDDYEYDKENDEKESIEDTEIIPEEDDF